MIIKKRFYKREKREVVFINQRIWAKEVRVIGADGQQLGILSKEEALAKAKEAELDLVLIAPKAKPPVCKIIDYGKYKYQLNKKEKESKKNQKTVDIKEIRIKPKTDEHDFNFKLKHIKKFLKNGNAVRVRVRFRGREVVHADRGRMMIKRISEEVKLLGDLQNMPPLQGYQMVALFNPKAEKERIRLQKELEKEAAKKENELKEKEQEQEEQIQEKEEEELQEKEKQEKEEDNAEDKKQ